VWDLELNELVITNRFCTEPISSLQKKMCYSSETNKGKNYEEGRGRRPDTWGRGKRREN